MSSLSVLFLIPAVFPGLPLGSDGTRPIPLSRPEASGDDIKAIRAAVHWSVDTGG